jgi:hypothetical protein
VSLFDWNRVVMPVDQRDFEIHAPTLTSFAEWFSRAALKTELASQQAATRNRVKHRQDRLSAAPVADRRRAGAQGRSRLVVHDR